MRASLSGSLTACPDTMGHPESATSRVRSSLEKKKGKKWNLPELPQTVTTSQARSTVATAQRPSPAVVYLYRWLVTYTATVFTSRSRGLWTLLVATASHFATQTAEKSTEHGESESFVRCT